MHNFSEVKTKGKKHRHRKKEVEEAYKLFKSKRGADAPSLRQFYKWLAGENVPDGFPGIKSLMKFVEWIDKWDRPERKKAERPIGGMSEEETYRKKRKE